MESLCALNSENLFIKADSTRNGENHFTSIQVSSFALITKESLSSIHVWAPNLEYLQLQAITIAGQASLKLDNLKILRLSVMKGIENLYISCPELLELDLHRKLN